MKFLSLSLNHWTLSAFILAFLQNYCLSEAVDNNDNHEDSAPIFYTKSGPVQGTVVKTDSHKDLNVLYGIPFSEPPVGHLRFKPPKKVQPWTSVLDVKKPRPTCYQQLPKESSMFDSMRVLILRPWSEDCLHLNIWTPNVHTEKVPVIFFIHGGGFILGSGTTLIDGTAIASNEFVVVTFNYRLGVFGFLSLGNDEAPGNLGLMDQILALQWVKENVEVFGGDPEQITLLGISAGGASVGFHLLSPKSKGLFKRAVLMSGVPTNWWSIKDHQFIVKKSQELLSALGCQSENSSVSLQCLQQRHPEDVLELSRTKTFDIEMDFGPVVDGKFVTEHPSVSVDSGRFNKADVMLGTTIDEGAGFMIMINEDILKTDDGRLYRRDFSEVIRRSHPSLSEIQSSSLEVLYSSATSPNDPLMLRNAAKNVYSDSWFNCRVDELAEKLSRTENSVYRYVYNYKMGSWHKYTPQWAGATHGEDQAPLLMPMQFFKNMGVSGINLEVYERFRKHIENFARNGDPNLEPGEYPDEPDWPKFDAKKLALNFANKSTVLPVERQRECASWLNLIPLHEQTSCPNKID